MQVAKHTPELAQLVVGAGGVGALVDYVAATKGNTRLPGIMALGYIAAFSETLGLAVIAEKGLVRPLPCLHGRCCCHVLCGVHSTLIVFQKGRIHFSAEVSLEFQMLVLPLEPAAVARSCLIPDKPIGWSVSQPTHASPSSQMT